MESNLKREEKKFLDLFKNLEFTVDFAIILYSKKNDSRVRKKKERKGEAG